VREWWRWTLRGVAVLALVAGGVLLLLHPSASYDSPLAVPAHLQLSEQCDSPLNQIRGTQWSSPASRTSILIPTAIYVRLVRVQSAACGSATNGRAYVAEALGIGAVLLLGLSLSPRRRALATKQRLETSPV
jgi:hypothetical protein